MTAQTVPPKRKGMPSLASQSLTQVDKARKTQLIVLRQTKTKGLEQPAQAKRPLHVEEELHHVTFLHDVLLPFSAQPTFITGFRE